MPKEIVILPKPVWNVSCHNDKVWHSFELPSTLVALENVSKFVCLLVLSMAIIITNVLFVLVLMNRRYNRKIFPQVNWWYQNIENEYNLFLFDVKYESSSYWDISFQPRYFLVSLGYNGVCSGCMTVLFSLYPNVAYNCWPYGDMVCLIQVICYKNDINVLESIFNSMMASLRLIRTLCFWF